MGCEEEIHGVHGHVLAMDMLRNPDSDHMTKDFVEHSIKSFTQECYSTSCDIPFIAKLAERTWYSKYKDLVEARVSLRPISLAAVVPTLQIPAAGTRSIADTQLTAPA